MFDAAFFSLTCPHSDYITICILKANLIGQVKTRLLKELYYLQSSVLWIDLIYFTAI
jgi:hypothetical protein